MKVKYITFASSNWSKFKPRLLNEFNAVKKEINIFNEHDIEDEHFKNFILKQKKVNRGFHNYIWKPYIIYQEFSKLENDVDLLVYFDAGCDFGKNGKYLLDIDKKLADFYNGNYLLLCLRPPRFCPIRMICTKEFKNKYNINNVFLNKFPHYQAGFICLKNNSFSLDFITKWKDMMKEDYPKICEIPYKKTPGIRNNGGDQIYMQYLLYKENITPMCLDFQIIKRIHG